jgi:ribosome biogenesis GTPase
MDNYLVAAEYLKIQPIILLNKIDLLDNNQFHEMKEYLAFYEKIGYTIAYSSIFSENGLQPLSELLKDKTSVLVGVSGVGKSSIIASLTHSSDIMIGETSAHGGLGKHTTTTTHLYHLPSGGNLIDSPGVREFTLWHLLPEEIMQGFVEFENFSDQCKFRNCSHRTEPDCAILKALDEGKISHSRYESYCKLLAD